MKSLNKIKSAINKNVNGEVYLKEWHKSIILEGKVKSWDDFIKAGQIAANKGYKGVVNNMEVEGFKSPPIKAPSIKDGTLDGKKVDVLVIGGGVTGCSILRELSKWDISCLLVDKEEDVAMHASSRNDGMVHPGIEPKPGSNKARFNVEGNRLYTQIAKELDVPLNRTGSLVLFDKKILKAAFPIVDARRKKNGLDKIKLVSQSEIKKYEPYADDNVGGALFFPSTAITCPYKMTVAYGENAVMNGAEISLNTIVLSIHKEEDKIVYVETNRGKIFPKVVIDAAGCFADVIADMAGDKFFSIHPRKGEILILDKKKGRLLHSVLAKPSLT
ncbi:MAG TPA: FAD/NAD(P)-binding oxidoreductase, partial [Clostridiaceae bacterium]|nr:FAD/NAD(P)-binding oxidoreductase [Clostridiaceae bacterium]